jgi:hypothetical protein
MATCPDKAIDWLAVGLGGSGGGKRLEERIHTVHTTLLIPRDGQELGEGRSGCIKHMHYYYREPQTLLHPPPPPGFSSGLFSWGRGNLPSRIMNSFFFRRFTRAWRFSMGRRFWRIRIYRRLCSTIAKSSTSAHCCLLIEESLNLQACDISSLPSASRRSSIPLIGSVRMQADLGKSRRVWLGMTFLGPRRLRICHRRSLFWCQKAFGR